MSAAAKKPVELIPADIKRCQAEMQPAHGAFVLGPRPPMRRCEAAPVTIATETKAGADGQVGSMSLCSECLAVFLKQTPKDFATFTSVPS